MLEIVLHTLVILLLTALLALFSYLYRLYLEDSRRASRRAREHLDHFHQDIAPRLKLERRRAMLTFGLLAQVMLVLVALAMGFAAETFADSPPRAIFQTAFFVVLQILVTYQFVPHVLVSRSNGDWLVPLIPLLRFFGYLVLPFQVLLDFFVSLLHLTEEEDEPPEEEPAQKILAELMEDAKEGHGVLEKEDIPLVAAVLKFADRTAREVMTPRPDMTGIAASASVAELRQLARQRHFSRYPVFGQSVDDVRGVVFVRDLLEVPEQEASTRKVEELVRPVLYVPETKPVVDVVRELQQETKEMAVVLDEYGSVAGLLTLEDLAEEILGEISDADQVRRAEIIKESETSYLVRGGIELDRVREALNLPHDSKGATTFAGLVHAWFGYVPRPGESLERDGLRIEVLEGTPRRVVRLRVIQQPAPAAAAPTKKGRKKQPA